jgi:hypothetical protein
MSKATLSNSREGTTLTDQSEKSVGETDDPLVELGLALNPSHDLRGGSKL